MAQYPINTHSLQFDENYTELQVIHEEETEETFPLDGSSQSLQVVIVDGDYVISAGSAISDDDLPHKYDIDGDAAVSFNGTRMGGYGSVDMRDMGRSGDFTVEYDLTCGSIRLAAMNGPYALWVKPASSSCFSYDEN